MADVGDTYISWTWLGHPSHVQAGKLDPTQWAAARELHARAVPTDGNASPDAVDQLSLVFHEGAFGVVDIESRLAHLLGEALPSRLRRELLERRCEKPLVVMTPSPLAAPMAWGLAALDHLGTRILDVADLTFEPPQLALSDRHRLPDTANTSHEALWIVDPQLPLSAVGSGLEQVVADSDLAYYRQLAKPESNRRKPQLNDAVRGRWSRWDLSTALQAHPDRLLYLGHVTGTDGQPGSTSLHLSDELDREHLGNGDWGAVYPWRRGPLVSRRGPGVGDHIPLSAIDLVAGGTHAPGNTNGDRLSGHELWPMPPRVAIIACESGADFSTSETFGLVSAVVDSGAEYVAATLWPLPTDHGFRHATNAAPHHRPLAALVRAIDSAYDSPNPIAALCRWQRSRLSAWRASGALTDSPILWASVCMTYAPPHRSKV